MTSQAAPETASVGDRLPDVRLSPAEGEPVRLHREFAGRSLWLMRAAPGQPAPTLSNPPDRSNAIVVDASLPAARSGWRPFAADSRWCELIPSGVVLELDTNLRVIALHDPERPLRPRGPEPPEALTPAQASTCAPVLQVENVLDADLCARLVEYLLGAGAGGEPSMVLVLESGTATPRLDPAIKMRRETILRDTALELEVDRMLARRAIPEIARAFHFQVSRRDPFKVLAYPESAGYFRAHRDNDTSDVAYRRFAVSINLNTGAYAGGEFRFPEFGPARYATGAGGVLAFSCSLLHEVTPVENGTRYALTTFLA